MAREVTLLLGPPGTGKTTAALNEVDKAIKSGVNPSKIAFMAFTKKAATEAIQRASDRFNLTYKELPYFRTLHSLAYKQLGLNRKNVMNPVHYDELGDILGLKFNVKYNYLIEHPSAGESLGDKCMRVYSMAKAKDISVEEQWYNSDEIDLSLSQMLKFEKELNAFKYKYGLLDFTDMLSKVDHHSNLNLDFCIIDEAQDLTPQQWKFARNIFKNVPKILICGDDDQAIFVWAGADPIQLSRLKGDRLVLPKSYRLPVKVHDLCNNIVNRINRRINKNWESSDNIGSVDWINDISELDLSNGTWMLLARHHNQLNDYVSQLKQLGFVYYYNHKWSNEDDYVKAVLLYERLRSGNKLSLDQLKLIADYTPGLNLPKLDDDYEYTDIFKHLMNGLNRPDWMSVLTRLSVEEREYIRLCKRNGESLVNPGRITVATIHAVKGGEAENVCILTDYNTKVYEMFEKDPDTEYRVLYVGLSRSSDKLFLLTPKTLYHYQI